MAKITIDYSTLYKYNQELIALNESIIILLIEGRIETFMKHNRDKIERMHQSIERTQKKYLRFSDDNQFMYELDGKTLQTLPGVLLKEYEDEIKALMATKVQIITN